MWIGITVGQNSRMSHYNTDQQTHRAGRGRREKKRNSIMLKSDRISTPAYVRKLKIGTFGEKKIEIF